MNNAGANVGSFSLSHSFFIPSALIVFVAFRSHFSGLEDFSTRTGTTALSLLTFIILAERYVTIIEYPTWISVYHSIVTHYLFTLVLNNIFIYRVYVSLSKRIADRLNTLSMVSCAAYAMAAVLFFRFTANPESAHRVGEYRLILGFSPSVISFLTIFYIFRSMRTLDQTLIMDCFLYSVSSPWSVDERRAFAAKHFFRTIYLRLRYTYFVRLLSAPLEGAERVVDPNEIRHLWESICLHVRGRSWTMQRVDATVCRLDYDDIVRAVEKIGKVEKLIQQEKKVLLRLHLSAFALPRRRPSHVAHPRLCR